MASKQEINGTKGENRTADILLDKFTLFKVIPDTEGRDLIAESNNSNNQVYAIIQAKFFEGTNEVKIRKEYVWDGDEIKTEFFAMLHSGNGNQSIVYFFSANDIVNTWQLKPRSYHKKRIEYYIFKLTKKNIDSFLKYKNPPHSEIYEKIEEGISKTNESRNQRNIKAIKNRFKKPSTVLIYGESNQELFDSIKEKHIVDKLYTALRTYDKFRRIVPWRLINKISFREKNHTLTIYDSFTLKTEHSEILSFFENLELNNGITIKDTGLFANVPDYKRKVEYIIRTLNNNLIFTIDGGHKRQISLSQKDNYDLNYASYKAGNLNFVEASHLVSNPTNNLWCEMESAYVLVSLGLFDEAFNKYNSIITKAKEQKENIIYFFASFNLRIVAHKTFKRTCPNISSILDYFDYDNDMMEILESYSNYSLYNSYKSSIDDLYLKVKDYKQRREINNTYSTVNKAYCKIAEFSNAFDGNFLILSLLDENHSLYEKFIESCIVSYSMNTGYSNHLASFDDYLVDIALNHCDSSKLLSFFQRNDVKSLPYKSTINFLNDAIDNFFSKENIDFLYTEVVYFDHRVKNPALSRKVFNILENLFILIAYLDCTIDLSSLIKKVSYFYDKLEVTVSQISLIALVLFNKIDSLNSKDIILLVEMLIKKEHQETNYLLTNCLAVLKEKDYKFTETQSKTVERIIDTCIEHPESGTLKSLHYLLDDSIKEKLSITIETSLKAKFNDNLFYQAVISNTINFNNAFWGNYLKPFNRELDYSKNSMFYSSPYTGISEPLRSNLNKLAEVIIVLDNNELTNNPIIKKITKRNPYYEFILNIKNFKYGDKFNRNWILENQSEIVLNEIATQKTIAKLIKKSLLDKYDKEIAKVFIKFLT